MVDHQIKSVTEASIGKLLLKLRCDGKILSLLKVNSISRVRHLVGGALGVGIGVAGLLFALRHVNILHIQVPWVAEQRASSKGLNTVAGLQNLGNNCFLNVILQALASCGCFHSFLQSILDVQALETEEELAEKLPLTVALVSLLEELCILHEERIVLSPRRVMLAMGPHVSSFNLTRQQDAAEAFLLVLSSLEEEILDCFVPRCSSLVDVSAFPCRVTSPKVCKEGPSECKRWQQQFFGQFDGIVGSILTCRSCSSQVSVDLEFFRCLPITPVFERNASMNYGCTLEDCLKHFTSLENLENYRCDRCSHISALKYLLLKPEENEAKIKSLSQCVKFGLCNCKSLFSQDGVVWPECFSHACKRLIIARCPRILCIQLQRASMSTSGEIIKIQGHISFPFILDLFPFTAAAKEIVLGTLEESILKQVEQQQASSFSPSHFRMPRQLQMLPCMHSFMREDFSGQTHLGCNFRSSNHVSSDGICEIYGRYSPSGSKRTYSEHRCFEAHSQSTCQQSNEEVSVSHCSAPSRKYSYILTSVVEHYGGSESGHYAVYRKLTLAPDKGDSLRHLQTSGCRWVYISDHEVSMVSEETVLGAEASLLFYERIDMLK
uniref:Ubiquitin carboxyl-terminal hydrolase n=1 Tax=Anthurium amnicola TaxID=1678845 RepID=A0A1D1XT10_9ARAE